jgi:hypothetical protein
MRSPETEDHERGLHPMSSAGPLHGTVRSGVPNQRQLRPASAQTPRPNALRPLPALPLSLPFLASSWSTRWVRCTTWH